jgi:hypothetical protein
VIELESLSGTVAFRNLEFGPLDESAMPEGLPEMLSGTVSWSCDPLERVPPP